jgi:hypothetical protein
MEKDSRFPLRHMEPRREWNGIAAAQGIVASNKVVTVRLTET